ncbi:MAG: hypothetical protein AAFY71_28755 [Bacteroidota bacterium]
MFETILILNAVWFGLGFHLFAIRTKVFAKILVPKEERHTPVYDMFAWTGKFMGGFNFSFCILSVLLVLNTDFFPDARQRIILLVVFATAHGSQFLGNVPVALDNRKGKGVWQVKGLMLFIFVTDLILTILNLVAAGMYAF